MAIKLSSLKSLKYHLETDSTYGVNQSGSVTYKTFRHLQDSNVALEEEMLANDIQQQIIDGMAPSIVGRRRCSVSAKGYLYGATVPLSGTATGAGAPTPATHEVADMLAVVMGGIFAMSGTTQSGAGSASGTFTAQSPAVAPVGQVIGLLNSAGKLEARKVRAASTFVTTLSFVPSSGQTIYNSHTAYLREDCSGSLQFYMKGHAAEDAWVATGLNGNFTLENVLGQLPKIAFDLKGATWFTGASGASLPKETYASSSAVSAFRDSKVFLYVYPSGGSRMADELKCKSVSFKPAITYADVDTAGGVENIARKVRTRNPAGVMSVEIQTYFEDRTYFTARDNATEYGLLVQIGSVPGKTVVICTPRMQLINVVKNDVDGLAGQTLSFKCMDDTATPTTGFDELAQSVFTISFL